MEESNKIGNESPVVKKIADEFSSWPVDENQQKRPSKTELKWDLKIK